MTQQFTPAQLEAWAGLGPWESDIDMYRAAPDLARLVLEKDAEIARLREIIRVAKANIFNIQIGLESGTTKHAASEQLAKVRTTLKGFDHD